MPIELKAALDLLRFHLPSKGSLDLLRFHLPSKQKIQRSVGSAAILMSRLMLTKF